MSRKKKHSVSDIADKLTKQIGKYENDMKEGDPISKRTAKMMMQKTQDKLDKVFAEQERIKQQEFAKGVEKLEKKYGGMNYRYGGPPPTEDTEDLIPYTTTRPVAYSGNYNTVLKPGIDSDKEALAFQIQQRTNRVTPEEYARMAMANLDNPMDYMSNYRAMVPREGAIPAIIPQAISFNYGGYVDGSMRRYQEGGIPPGLSYDQWLQAHLAENPNDPDFFTENDFKEFYDMYNRHNSPTQMTFPDGTTADPLDYTSSSTDNVGTEYSRNVWNPKTGSTEQVDFKDVPANNEIITARDALNNRPSDIPSQDKALPGGMDGLVAGDSPGIGDTSWQNLLYKGAAYAPTIYNAIRGLQKPQELEAERFQNPYERRALELMADRRYNVNPELEAIKRSRAMAQRNIANASGGNAATYLGNIGAAQSRTDAANAATYARKQNMDNQYMAQEAGMLGNLGSQRAMRELQIQDINDRNRAARNAYMSSAMSGLSNIAQNERAMNNMARRDEMLAEAMKAQGYYFSPEFSRQGRRFGFEGYKFNG